MVAVDFYCELVADAVIEEVVERLQVMIGGTATRDDHVFVILTDAIIARVTRVTDPRVKEVAMEEWGIDPRIRISFRLKRNAPEDEYFAAQREFSVASVRLAEDLDTDAILRVEMERLIMRRINGRVTLYDWWPDWHDPSTLAALPPGYIIVNE